MRLPLAVKALGCNLGLLKEIVYPRKCAVCKRIIEEGFFCETCRQGFILHKRSSFVSAEENYLHADIQLIPEDVLKELHLLYKYDGAIKDALRQLKFANRYELLYPLREELECALPIRFKQWLSDFDYATCIPTSPERLAQRGFDIPQELFRPFLRLRAGIYVPDLLQRCRETAPLFNLQQDERRQELLGCFAVNEKYFVYGKKILLCDDIYTTGSTFVEAATALKRAGAAEVVAFAFSAAKENW